jgi:DNA-binding NarL/FixJ family response regulator
MMRNRALELSKQEVMILKLSWDGKSVKETAEWLKLSPKTVKNYRANIYDKFQVRCVELMLRKGVEWGYLGVETKAPHVVDWP